MGQVTFKFKNDTSDADVKAGLQSIAAIRGVFNTEAVFPGDKNPAYRTMYVSNVQSKADDQDVADQIKGLPNMEYSSVAGTRRPS